MEVQIKYQRLCLFCYLYGLMGHSNDSCKRLLMIHEDDVTRKCGPDLQAEPKNSITASTSWYLLQANFFGANNAQPGQDVRDEKRQHHNGQGDHVINLNNHEQDQHTKLMATIFQNPKLISNQSLHHRTRAKGNNHDAMNIEIETVAEIIVGEKKLCTNEHYQQPTIVNAIPSHNLTPNSSLATSTPKPNSNLKPNTTPTSIFRTRPYLPQPPHTTLT